MRQFRLSTLLLTVALIAVSASWWRDRQGLIREAARQQAIAEEQKHLAEEQRIIAEHERQFAEIQRGIARKNWLLAEESRSGRPDE